MIERGFESNLMKLTIGRVTLCSSLSYPRGMRMKLLLGRFLGLRPNLNSRIVKQESIGPLQLWTMLILPMLFLPATKLPQKFQELFHFNYMRSGMLTPNRDIPVLTAELHREQIASLAVLSSASSSFKIGWS